MSRKWQLAIGGIVVAIILWIVGIPAWVPVLIILAALAVPVVGYMMLDRPTATIADFPIDFGLSYGVFFALGGAATLALAGLRIRHAERLREAAGSVTPEAEAGRTPTSASPTRSPR